MSLREEVWNCKPYMAAIREDLHRHPELSLHENRTAERIEEELDKLGLTAHRRIGETGVLATLDTGKPGKTIFFRADTDALPVKECNDVPYKSQNDGVMHACGHDGHTAALLGAARILLAHKDELKGKILFAFQQAEEIGSGARQFVAAGVMHGVDRAYGLHLSSGMDTGTFSLKSGPYSACCDQVRIHITGKSAHVSRPDEGVDALFIASLIVVQIQSIVSRIVPPAESAVVGFGSCKSGTYYNIVAKDASLEGTIRAFTPETRKRIRQAIHDIVDGACKVYGATGTVEIDNFADPVVNDRDAFQEVVAAATKLVGAEHVESNPDKRFGADDFADYTQVVKSAYVMVGSRKDAATGNAHHSEHFDFDEDALCYACALEVQLVLDTQ